MKKKRTNPYKEANEAFLGCNTESFVKALDTVDQRYGSLEAYIKGPLGLTDDDIRTLRQRYLEVK